MEMSKKELREIDQDVRIEKKELEQCIYNFMERMIIDSDMNLKQAEDITINHCRIFVRSFYFDREYLFEEVND
tara:strand:+ start:525 stop:743 length:219 start_codon:yes stop_codon:yes gene_type:complete